MARRVATGMSAASVEQPSGGQMVSVVGSSSPQSPGHWVTVTRVVGSTGGRI